MKTSIFINKKGSTLVATLFIIALLFILISVMGQMIMREKNLTIDSRKSTTVFYVAEAGEQRSRVQLISFIDNNLNTILSQWNGNGHIIQHPDTFFNSLSSMINQTLSQQDASNYSVVYFNDKSNDKVQQSDEEGFVSVDSVIEPYRQTYNYRFTVTSYGEMPRSRIRKVITTGTVSVSASAKSFAKYALFTREHVTAAGEEIWFTDRTSFDGPVHTNGAGNSKFRFYGNVNDEGKSGTFSDDITSSNSDIRWYNNGSAITTTPPLDDLHPQNGTKDIPLFRTQYERNKPVIDFPPNDFSQERAALGGNVTDTSPVTDTERRNLLGLPAGGAVPNGIYVPTNGANVSGGIYVKGNCTMTLSVDANNNQVYTLVQTNTYTITVDIPNNKTYVKINTNPATEYNSVLNGMVYVAGAISALGGSTRNPAGSTDPATAPPAIQTNTRLNITATGDISINKDIKYQTDPRGVDGIFGTVDDIMNAKNVLGLYSTGGNVRISNPCPKDINVHGTIMASGNGRVFTADNYDSRTANGFIHLLGGVISDRYGAVGTFNGATGQYVSGFGRDFVYDKRVMQGNSPPYFPTVGDFETNTPVIAQTSWREELI